MRSEFPTRPASRIESSAPPSASASSIDFLEGCVWDLIYSDDSLGAATFPEPNEPELATGNIVDRYQLLSELGRGGHGVVFRANRLEPVERIVAIKFLLGGNVHFDSSMRFERECQILAELNHPGLARLLDSGRTDAGIPYIVMPLIEGESIDTYVQRHGCEPIEIAELLIKVCTALEHAHGRQTIHRDLTPRNILVQFDGQPVVTDFGLARWTEQSAPRTASGIVLGTPGYLAPEQCDGETEAGFKPTVDVYGLGATLYALLTGKPPFRELTTFATISAIKSSPPERPSRLNPKVDPSLDMVCLKCLSKRPEDRYREISHLRDDLQRFVHQLPVKARRLPAYRRVLDWTRQNRTLSNLLVAFLLFVVAALTGLTIVWQAARSRQLEAEANLRLANQTLHELFDPINALIPTEMDLEQKHALLERVLSIYTPIVKRQPDDVQLRSELATIWFQLGDVTYKLGHLERSEAARLEALQRFTDLAVQHPNASYDFSRFHSLYALSSIDPAKYDYADAHKCIVELAERFPDNADYLDAAAAASIMRAMRASANILRDDQREQLIHEGIEFAKRIDADAVEQKPELARHLGSGARALGLLAMKNENYPEAVLHFEAAVGSANALAAKVDECPPTLSYDTDVNRIYLAEALIGDGRHEEAYVVVSAALDHLAELIAESPDQPLFQQSLNRMVALRDEIKSRCNTDAL